MVRVERAYDVYVQFVSAIAYSRSTIRFRRCNTVATGFETERINEPPLNRRCVPLPPFQRRGYG